MQAEVRQPWFDSALERLEVRKGNRLLAMDPTLEQTSALRGALGSAGELTVVMLDRQIAEQLAERQWPGVRVLAHATTGRDSFGTYDSLLMVPGTGPILPPDEIALLACTNLRPGGRFVIDVPAEDMVPDLRSAWLELGWDEERLAPLRGVSDVELTEAVRDAGLRSVRSSLGSHLLHLPSPTELAACYADVLDLSDEAITELGHEILRKRQDPGPLDALVHRSQVHGQR